MRVTQAVLGLLLVAAVAVGFASDWSRDEFAGRRARLLTRLDSSAAVVMRAADPKTRSNDVAYRYRQESNFLYLTGVTQSGAYLILSPRGVDIDGVIVHAVVFHSSRDDRAGKRADSLPDGIVLPPDRFDEVFHSAIKGLSTLYVSTPDIGFVNDWLNGRRVFLERESRKAFEQSHAGLKVKNVAPLVAGLRQIKSAGEVQRIRRAVAITGDGLRRAMAECRAGAKEYELQAAVEYEMTRQGAAYPGFPSIVGSGENSLILHYDENSRTVQKGEVVVMDVGAEYDGYSADVTRTLPVSGQFTKEQREIYNLVLSAQGAAFAAIKPGATFAQVEQAARGVYAAKGFQRFTRHGVSHHLGLDVHDVGALDTLRVGMVITVEPGLYIAASDTTIAPAYRGWGVRIEDDVLVTEGGNEVLSNMIPRRAEEIEAIMRRPKR